MNRFNLSGRAILLAVLACVSITLLLFTFRVVTVRRWCSTLNWIKTIDNSSRRHYNTSDEMRNGTGDQFSPDHQQTVDYIRRHISHPSLTRPRQLVKSDRKDASQHGQSAFVDKLLSRRRDGFFVECGAGDGEVNSNSLFFRTAAQLDRASDRGQRGRSPRAAQQKPACICVESLPQPRATAGQVSASTGSVYRRRRHKAPSSFALHRQHAPTTSKWTASRWTPSWQQSTSLTSTTSRWTLKD